MASITFAPPKAQQQACVPYPPEVKHLNKDTVIITIGDKTFYATGHGICICTNEEELNKITQFRGAPKRKAGSDDEEDEQLAKQQKAKKRALAAVERYEKLKQHKEQIQKVLEATPTGPTAQVNSAAASQEDIAGAPLKQPYSPKSGLLVAIEMDEAAARAKDEVVKTLETVFTDSDSDSDSDSKTEA